MQRHSETFTWCFKFCCPSRQSRAPFCWISKRHFTQRHTTCPHRDPSRWRAIRCSPLSLSTPAELTKKHDAPSPRHPTALGDVGERGFSFTQRSGTQLLGSTRWKVAPAPLQHWGCDDSTDGGKEEGAWSDSSRFNGARRPQAHNSAWPAGPPPLRRRSTTLGLKVTDSWKLEDLPLKHKGKRH